MINVSSEITQAFRVSYAFFMSWTGALRSSGCGKQDTRETALTTIRIFRLMSVEMLVVDSNPFYKLKE